MTPPPNASGYCAAVIRTAPNMRDAHSVRDWLAAMLAGGLIDTGAILALLDRDDRWHRACAEAFATLMLPLATSAAVLAELFHLVGDNRRDVAAAWKFLRSGAVSVAPIGDADMAELDELMARYRDRPMDFADATLVYLARRESISTILTIDHDDFETYRIGRNRPFRILPERRGLQR